MILISYLSDKHRINTPRTHDGQGHTVHEPPQCQACLQAWPCEVRQLLDLIEADPASHPAAFVSHDD